MERVILEKFQEGEYTNHRFVIRPDEILEPDFQDVGLSVIPRGHVPERSPAKDNLLGQAIGQGQFLELIPVLLKLRPFARRMGMKVRKVCGDDYVPWISYDVKSPVSGQAAHEVDICITVREKLRRVFLDEPGQVPGELVLVKDSGESHSKSLTHRADNCIQRHRGAFVMSVERNQGSVVAQMFGLNRRHCKSMQVENLAAGCKRPGPRSIVFRIS